MWVHRHSFQDRAGSGLAVTKAVKGYAVFRRTGKSSVPAPQAGRNSGSKCRGPSSSLLSENARRLKLVKLTISPWQPTSNILIAGNEEINHIMSLIFQVQKCRTPQFERLQLIDTQSGWSLAYLYDPGLTNWAWARHFSVALLAISLTAG